MKNNKIKVLVFDFENDKNGDLIFFYGENIKNNKEIYQGYTIKEFFEIIKNNINAKKIVLYFHNLNYDANFIITHLLKNNILYLNQNILKNDSFNCFVSDKGEIFNIKYKIKYKTIFFYDSFKIIRRRVDELASNTPEEKIKINFEKKINIKTIKKRCINDVKIVCNYLYPIIKKYGVVGTASKMALNNFIKNSDLYRRNQKYYTPFINNDEFKYMSKAFSGGLNYLNPQFVNKTVKNICVFDVNSMYPYIMAYYPIPYGIPQYFKGEYKKIYNYDLYIQHIKADFEIKENKIPFVKDCKRGYFNLNAGVVDSTYGEVIDLYLTGEELKLFYQNYKIRYIKFVDGFMFNSINGFFKNYILKIYKKKSEEKNPIKKEIYKILLNSLYGKFATKLSYIKKTPYLDNKGILHFKNDGVLETKGLYLPIPIFITSYARVKLINDIQKNIDKFIYCDTDSIILIQKDDIDLDIDAKKIGCYKMEMMNATGKFLKEKCYIIKDKYEFKKIIAGLTEEQKEQVNFKNFKMGAKFYSLRMERTPFGAKLKKEKFIIK